MNSLSSPSQRSLVGVLVGALIVFVVVFTLTFSPELPRGLDPGCVVDDLKVVITPLGMTCPPGNTLRLGGLTPGI